MKKNTQNKILYVLIYHLLNVFVFLASILLIYSTTLFAFKKGHNFAILETSEKPDKEISIQIPPDTKLKDVAKLLEKNGVIANKYTYILENLLKGNTENYKGGEYVLNVNMEISDINSLLRQNNTGLNEVTVTIYEGYTLNSIAQLLESRGVVSAEEFIETATNMDFNYFFLKDKPKEQNRLEGYLFPDTYIFYENSSPSNVIDKLLTRFEEIYTNDLILETNKNNLTINDVIIMASIIEKEINDNISRDTVAYYIKNRLNSNMNLELPSTIAYYLNKDIGRLTEIDLQTDSPFNTFINQGLPPSPISNPGLDSIKGVLYSTEENYIIDLISYTNK